MNDFLNQPLISSQNDPEDLDPAFTLPDMNVPATPPGPGMENDIDPGFSVVPPFFPDWPGNNRPVNPNRPPYLPTPSLPGPSGQPCVFCSNNQWLRGAVRMINAATGYNAFTILIDNRQAYSGLNFAEVTQYRQLSQGYHRFTIMAANGYVYLQKSVYIGDGMTTVAIVNTSNGIDLTTIADTACPTSSGTSCFRVCNLAFYSGDINAVLGNILFNSVGFRQATSFSRVRSGSYNLVVSRSARPGNPLVSTTVNLNSNRIYTLYVLNWNTSADTIQTLLVEDRRG